MRNRELSFSENVRVRHPDREIAPGKKGEHLFLPFDPREIRLLR